MLKKVNQGGISEHFIDTATGDYHVDYKQDIEAILNDCQDGQSTHTRFGNEMFHHVAEIPHITIMQWMQEDGVNVLALHGEELDKYVTRKLNSDYKKLKRISGRI